MTDKKEITPAQALEHQRTFMLGGIISAAMLQIKGLTGEWAMKSEEEQQEVISKLTKDVKDHVNKAVDLIKSDLHTSFKAKVDSVTFKDGVKAVLVMPNTKASHELADVQGSEVLIVLCDNKVYLGEGGIPEPEKDQPSLPIDGD